MEIVEIRVLIYIIDKYDTYSSKLMLDFLVTAGVICLTSAMLLLLLVVVAVVVVVSDMVLLQSFH